MQKEYENSLEVNIMFGYYGPGFLYGAWSPCCDDLGGCGPWGWF